MIEDNTKIGIKSNKFETYFTSNLIQKNEIEYFKIEKIKFNQIRIINKYNKYLISSLNENKFKFESNLNNFIENQEIFEIIDCING